MIKLLPLAASMLRFTLAPFHAEPLGTEHPPMSGPLLLAANHQSFLDGALLANEFLRLQKRPLHMVAYDEPFHHFFLGYFLRSGRCIPFRRGNSEAAEVMAGQVLAYLSRGEAVGMFPEGHINRRATLHRPRPGLAVFALASGAPVCPAGIVGSDRVLPEKAGFPRFGRKALVVFGAPLRFEAEVRAYAAAADDPAVRADLIDTVTLRVMTAIAGLCGKKYGKSS